MKAIQIFFVALVAFEHLYFMVLELFYWDKPKGLKAFGQTLEAAKSSKTLAKNQGLYNGFLAAGLIWAIVNENNFRELAIFFLSCVVVAGVFGAYSTKNSKLFYVQAMSALIGLLLVLFGN